MADRFLAGVRVLAVGESRAVGYAGKMLCDLGAEVWLLERPGRGHLLRRRRPLLPSGVSGLFEFLARDTRSLTCDTDLEDGRELARRFAGLCSGVLADRAVWERIGGDGLAGPVGIVTVSSRGAPFPVDQDSEFVDFHEGGGGYMTPGRVADPVKEHPIDAAHGGQASYVGGLYAAIALLQAVAVARSSGHAIHNDVSLQSALAAMMVLNVPWFTYAGVAPSRQRSAGRPGRAMGGFIRVKDGRVAITMIEEHQWDGLVRALGAPEWTALPTFTTQLDRSAHWDGIRAFLEEEWRGLTTREVMERCQAENVPVFTVREMDEILASAHEAARGFFAPSEPDGVMLPTNPWMIDGAALGSRGRSPGIGEHTRAALTMLGLSDEDFDAFHEAGVI